LIDSVEPGAETRDHAAARHRGDELGVDACPDVGNHVGVCQAAQVTVPPLERGRALVRDLLFELQRCEEAVEDDDLRHRNPSA
jgi:hypothetical protein